MPNNTLDTITAAGSGSAKAKTSQRKKKQKDASGSADAPDTPKEGKSVALPVDSSEQASIPADRETTDRSFAGS